MEVVNPLRGCGETNTEVVASSRMGLFHPSSTSPAFITLRTVLALPNPSHFTVGLWIFPFPGGSNPSCSPPGKSHPQELRRGVVLLLSSSHCMLQI